MRYARCGILAGAILAPWLFAVGAAFADGCFVFVWRKGADINEPNQKAIILYADGREDLILQVRFEGPVEEFGWLIPVPGKPEVAKASIECFYELSQHTQYHGRRGRQMSEAAGAVQVLEIKTVGSYDIAVLAAGDARALSSWLAKHKFNWPRDHRDVLEHYVRKKWYFVAVKINLGKASADETVAERLRTGELHPLKLSFDTDKCVYPLKISSVNGGYSDVDIYVLGAERLVCDRMNFFSASNSDRTFYPHHFSRCQRDLPRLKDGQWRLTKHTRRFYAGEMDDLTFRPCPAGDGEWEKARARFLRERFTTGRKHFFEDLREYEAELGHHKLSGRWRRGAARTPLELERIRAYLWMVGECAPEVVPELALDLLGEEQYQLLGLLLQRPGDADLGGLAVQLAQAVLDIADPVGGTAPQSHRARRDSLGAVHLKLLLQLGPRAGPGAKLLAEAFLEVKPEEIHTFPVPADVFGQLLQDSPHEAAGDRLVEFLGDGKAPVDLKSSYALQVFRYTRSEKAVEPLISMLESKAAVAAIWALSESGDRRAVKPLLTKKDSHPSHVFAAILRISPDDANAAARDWLGDAKKEVRGVAVYHLGQVELPEGQRRRAVRGLTKAVARARDAAELRSLAEALQKQYSRAGDPGLGDAHRALISRLSMLERSLDTKARRNAEYDLKHIRRTIKWIEALNQR